jgi:hypothetical protein
LFVLTDDTRTHCAAKCPAKWDSAWSIFVSQRWQIERDWSVWTATEHPSPTAIHVIIAHDLDAVEQKIIEAELAS